MGRKAVQVVENIAFSDIKKGDIIQLENESNQFYVVLKSGQDYVLIPVDLSKHQRVSVYSINKPTIRAIFDGRDGNCSYIRKDASEVMEVDE